VQVLLHRDTVQDPARQRAGTERHLGASDALADHIFSTWRSRWAA
jgi:GMP synthase (glutamine-hydrolysing)